MTTLKNATETHLQEVQRERVEKRQYDNLITSYRRGFAACFAEQGYANPYQIGSDEAAGYHRGYGDARLRHYLNRTCLRVDETEMVDRLLLERGRTAQVERVCLRTGVVLMCFTIGQKAHSETEWRK